MERDDIIFTAIIYAIVLTICSTIAIIFIYTYKINTSMATLNYEKVTVVGSERLVWHKVKE